MPSTKEEIEKMLDDIQKGKPSESSKKNKYKDMSLDDLLNEISSSKKYKSESAENNRAENSEEINFEKPAPEPEPEPEPEPQPEPEPEFTKYEPEEMPFRKIFDESSKVFTEEKQEEIISDDNDDNFVSEEESEVKNTKKASNKIIMTIMIIFSVIGIISTVNYGIRYAQNFREKEINRSDFEEAVYPAVIMDIEAFQNGNELSSQQIIGTAIWKLIISGDIDKYNRTFDIISVPASDIESEAARLFNTEFSSLQHQTVGTGEMKFYYNEETGIYNIPSKPLFFSYKPHISAFSKNGDVYTVEVEYFQEQPSWMEGNPNFYSGVSKTVKFRLQSNGNDYSILSMEIVKVNQLD